MAGMIYAATADGDSNDDDNSDHMDDGQLLESRESTLDISRLY